MPSALGAALLSAGGALTGAVGSIVQGQSAAQADKYNGQIALANATIQKRNADQAGLAGEEQAAISGMKTRATVGDTKANQAASGIDVNKGSAVDVRTSEQQLGKLDALTIRSNAAKQAYGYETEAMSDTAQSELDKQAASSAQTAGYIGAAGTLLGKGADAATKFKEYQAASGFTI